MIMKEFQKQFGEIYLGAKKVQLVYSIFWKI